MTALLRAVPGPVLLLGALAASSCPTAPRGVATFMRATVDDRSWTADGYTDAGLVHPWAEYHAADSTLILVGIGHDVGDIRWDVELEGRALLADTAPLALGDSGTAGHARLHERFRTGTDTLYVSTASAPGSLTITTFDTTTRIITGRFAFPATNPDARRTVRVTDGAFTLYVHVVTGETRVGGRGNSPWPAPPAMTED